MNLFVVYSIRCLFSAASLLPMWNNKGKLCQGWSKRTRRFFGSCDCYLHTSRTIFPSSIPASTFHCSRTSSTFAATVFYLTGLRVEFVQAARCLLFCFRATEMKTNLFLHVHIARNREWFIKRRENVKETWAGWKAIGKSCDSISKLNQRRCLLINHLPTQSSIELPLLIR